jgi:hypothetical protein
MQVIGILDEQFVDILAGRIRGSTRLNGILSILPRAHVGAASRQDDSLARVHQVSDPGRTQIQGNFNRFAA